MAELERLLTMAEVALHLGVPVKSLYAWRASGKGPAGIRVGKHVRFRSSDLQSWIDRQYDEQRRSA